MRAIRTIPSVATLSGWKHGACVASLIATSCNPPLNVVMEVPQQYGTVSEDAVKIMEMIVNTTTSELRYRVTNKNVKRDNEGGAVNDSSLPEVSSSKALQNYHLLPTAPPEDTLPPAPPEDTLPPVPPEDTLPKAETIRSLGMTANQDYYNRAPEGIVGKMISVYEARTRTGN